MRTCTAARAPARASRKQCWRQRETLILLRFCLTAQRPPAASSFRKLGTTFASRSTDWRLASSARFFDSPATRQLTCLSQGSARIATFQARAAEAYTRDAVASRPRALVRRPFAGTALVASHWRPSLAVLPTSEEKCLTNRERIDNLRQRNWRGAGLNGMIGGSLVGHFVSRQLRLRAGFPLWIEALQAGALA